MIDGISGRGGPIRGAIGARTSPIETGTADPARALRRTAAAGEITTSRSGRSALLADMASAPPVNAARVAELRAQIAGGRFPVDPVAIADAMLRLDRGKP